MGFFDNKTVTLFNRSFNAETEEETYYPTLLEGVDLVETKGAKCLQERHGQRGCSETVC